MRLLARDGLIFLLFCGCRPKAGLQGARRLRLLLLLPGLLSSKMNADSLSDWAYFCLLSCSFSFYDVCLLRSDNRNNVVFSGKKKFAKPWWTPDSACGKWFREACGPG